MAARRRCSGMDISEALGRRIPFASHLGIQLVEQGGGRAVLMLEIKPEHMNRFDVAHGGVVMTLLDIAMAVAASSLDPAAQGTITVEMKTTFIGAATGEVRIAMAHVGRQDHRRDLRAAFGRHSRISHNTLDDIRCDAFQPKRHIVAPDDIAAAVVA